LHAVQRGVLDVVSPIQEGASRALKPFRDLAGWVGDTLDAKGEVKDLRAERDALRRSAVAGTAARRENAELKRLLELDEAAGLERAGPVGARVIGQDPSLWYGQVTINKGTSDGVRVDQPVVTGEGLVGRVSFASAGTAIVRLITDHTTRVSARVNATGITGVVRVEAGRPTELVMDYTRRDDDVRQGQVIVTAGTRSNSDRLVSLYPPNVPIGTVTRVDQPATDDQEVHLRPFADLRRMEFVQVLTRAPNDNRPAE
jgi:rod shape-determining protein MreC